MALTMAEVARDYETDGVPSSGPHKIKKNNLRGWGAWVEGIIGAFTSNGGLIYSSLSALNADLAHAANTMAWVIGDATVANNGVYGKVGASGTGSWTRRADLPFSFIIASDAGAGTANAIQATTSIPVSASALVWMNIFEANTAAPVTVSFNGGSALIVKTNAGNDVAVGGLTAGMIVMGIVSGSTFRLVSDQASSAVLAACEAAQAAAEAAAASARVTLKSLGADDTGVVDASAILTSAVGTYPHLVVSKGTYLINANVTIPPTCTVEFENGGLLNVGAASPTITWNGGIRAGLFQRIFSGNLIQSVYNRIGDTPYTFALQGSPKIDYASPFWFGAAGDGATDDQAALHCAQWFGNNMLLPRATYVTSVSLILRRDYQFLRFLGGAFLKSSGASIGQVLGIRGDPPTTAAGEPARYAKGIVIENANIDAADATNNNGLGLSFAKQCTITFDRMLNVGRKAVTMQYWVQGCVVRGGSIDDAATEAGSTHGAVSVEGQTAGLNYSLDGGVSSSADMLGADCYGNIIEIGEVSQSGYNYVVAQRCRANVVRIGSVGNCVGSGRHVVCADYAENNNIRIEKAGNTERSFIATTSLAVDNEIYVNGADAVGTGTDGYSVLDAGARNKISGECDHSNASTTNSRAIELQGNRAELSFFVRSCDSTTVIGGAGTHTRVTSRTKVDATGRRGVFAAGTNWRIAGEYNVGTGAIGIQVNGNYGKVNGATIDGDGAQRVLVGSGAVGVSVTGNEFTGNSPTADWTTLADLWSSGEKHSNIGDVSTYQCIRLGTRIDGTFGGTPLGNVAAPVGSTMRDTTGGKHYTKASASDATGWVVTGTQA
ncbi:hypothetical protein IB276_26280 [Ensifer sp. ENS04]|uniref:hypothetical protein n=1 Tax=Ensifer sp. ENS04 TaxID=2769281 RepID=UPI0017860ED0|nr:hypothetical protein [Ensifer sp. ENS04]MBD9542958.1 hypothetical protein [Ensifer sp. ENS04]